jgi:hypothetical protein
MRREGRADLDFVVVSSRSEDGLSRVEADTSNGSYISRRFGCELCISMVCSARMGGAPKAEATQSSRPSSSSSPPDKLWDLGRRKKLTVVLLVSLDEGTHLVVPQLDRSIVQRSSEERLFRICRRANQRNEASRSSR